MKSGISMPDVAMVAVLCAAIILSGIFAPPVVTIVGGVVSTLVGAFFVNARDTEAKRQLEAVEQQLTEARRALAALESKDGDAQ